MNERMLLNSLAQMLGHRSIEELVDEFLIAERKMQELDRCPTFRKCKSIKWRRRRNKQFYRVLGVTA